MADGGRRTEVSSLSTDQNKQTNRIEQTHRYGEQTDSCEWGGVLKDQPGEKGEEIKQNKNKTEPHRHRNSMVVTRGKGGCSRWKRVQWRTSGGRGRPVVGR